MSEKNLKKSEIMSEFLGVSSSQVYRWKKSHPILMNFIDKYCSENDILNFIQNEKIEKFEVADQNKEIVWNILQNLKSLKEEQIVITIEDFKLATDKVKWNKRNFISFIFSHNSNTINKEQIIYDISNLSENEFLLLVININSIMS